MKKPKKPFPLPRNIREKINFKGAVDFTCPFCGGHVDAGHSSGLTSKIRSGKIRKNVGTIMHSMPPCKEFIEKEVCDFLREARLKIEDESAGPQFG